MTSVVSRMRGALRSFQWSCLRQQFRRGLSRSAGNVSDAGRSDGVTPSNTIFALSSGHGKAGVAVIRVSGPVAFATLEKLSGKGVGNQERKALLRRLRHPESGDILDDSLVLAFKGPRSFTGEDVVEYHVHGGVAVISGVLEALGSVSGVRPAEPGEFTRRAFFNEKLDLTQVEGLADLINAETRAQRQQAMIHKDGAAGQMYERWRTKLVRAMANVEAYIDFSEDEGIEEDTLANSRRDVQELFDTISAHMRDNRCGERLRNGVNLAIVGRPDVGKSSLLNLLCQRDAAIVASGPGTTRDVLQVTADINGYPVNLLDTAGVRFGEDVGEVEREGVRRAQRAMSSADLRVCVQDCSLGADGICQRVLPEGFPCMCQQIEAETDSGDAETLIMLNKADTAPQQMLTRVGDHFSQLDQPPLHCIASCKTKDGFDAFLDTLEGVVARLCQLQGSEGPLIAHVRHRTNLQNALAYLEAALDYADSNDEVAMAEMMRLAAESLGHITGRIELDDILDVVFRDFCIGK